MGPQEYVQRMNRLLLILIEKHLSRMERLALDTTEAKAEVDIQRFLGVFFSYSFLQPDADSFIDCLAVWQCFVQHVQRQETVQRETGAVAVVSPLMKMCRYSHEDDFLRQV